MENNSHIIKKDEDTWIIKPRKTFDEKELLNIASDRMQKLYSEAVNLYQNANSVMEKTQVLKLIKEILKDERSFFLDAGLIRRSYKNDERDKIKINGVFIEDTTDANLESAMNKMMLEILSEKGNDQEKIKEMFKMSGIDIDKIQDIECKIVE